MSMTRAKMVAASYLNIAAASGIVSGVVATALVGTFRPAPLTVFVLAATGSALTAAHFAPRTGRWWPLVMTLAPLAFLVASVIFWVSAAYFRWMVGAVTLASPEDGMTLAATSWLPASLVGAAVYAAAGPAEETGTPCSTLQGGAKASAAALIVLPFVLQGVPNVVAPRALQVFAVVHCHGTPMLGTLVDHDMAVQWIPSAADVDVDWEQSSTVAIVNGQAITPLEVPPLLPSGSYFHRRYLMEGTTAVDSGRTGQTFANEYRSALFRAFTLGASPLPNTAVRAELEVCGAQ
ncbi:hypothetical protein [Cellulomonas sp. B6]|jgi:hypothetical protein|uniref:hypothetical protein n=1 Tax=Cellulomonas sp. B6 TaxID=1295626 RepID=UPI00073C238A|nr:hypothetical protein [Cellulomonas sp. B6]KSW29443.1 hypothetical protein ATM99_07910 [Cellulomonas sp. B6]